MAKSTKTTKKIRAAEPVMSDRTVLVTVEDLISLAMGPPDKNTVNYKVIQTVLHILARQLRMLETQVDISYSDDFTEDEKTKKGYSSSGSSPRSPKHSPPTSGRDKKGKKKTNAKGELSSSGKEPELPPAEKEKSPKGKKGKDDSLSSKEKEAKSSKEKEDKTSKEKEEKAPKEKEEKAPKEKEEKAPKEKEEKASNEKEEKAPKEKEEKASKEKEEKAPKEKEEKAPKEKEEKAPKEKEQKASKEKEEKAPKEKEEKAPKEKEQKASKEKEEKASKEKEEKAPKEKEEKASKKKDKSGKDRAGPGTMTTISEKEVGEQRDKVLIVEKGPARTGSVPRVGSIEVVTRSQFAVLEATVEELKQVAGPLPIPSLPDNEKLRADLAKGSASLTDTMNAMQVSARVQAAEKAVERMAGLLTQLAAAGALPDEFTNQIEGFTTDVVALQEQVHGADKMVDKTSTYPSSGVSRKSVAIDPMAKSSVRPSVKPSATSRVSHPPIPAGVTKNEMEDAMKALKDELMKSALNMTNKASNTADLAQSTAKAASDKLEIAVKLNTRINNLHSLTSDYSEQLSGFDAGLTTQMSSFKEQMVQMRQELKEGLVQLETVNNNAETAAVMELTEHYEGLVQEVDTILAQHQNLTGFQRQLADELRSLVEAIEMMREQKADRDEVLDGLRDKADNSRLAGLLTEGAFATARADLEQRLEMCYDKFHKQDQVWMNVLQDLTAMLESKAELMNLLALRDEMQGELRDIQQKLELLAIQLGEPKAAFLTRVLSREGRCGACRDTALMDPQDASSALPPALPALRPPPAPTPAEPCVPAGPPPTDEHQKEHMCLRWVGGSHTRVAGVRREQAAAPAPGARTRKYAGLGADGKFYMLEDEMLPCLECNRLGAGGEGGEGVEGGEGPRCTYEGAGDTGQL